ncbi:hypothetical protein SLA2020_513210 [Shorea laevis]
MVTKGCQKGDPQNVGVRHPRGEIRGEGDEMHGKEGKIPPWELGKGRRLVCRMGYTVRTVWENGSICVRGDGISHSIN